MAFELPGVDESEMESAKSSLRGISNYKTVGIKWFLPSVIGHRTHTHTHKLDMSWSVIFGELQQE